MRRLSSPAFALLMFTLGLVLALGGCEHKIVDPTAGNRDPVLLSLSVFPGTINVGDSAIVMCKATDPDGNTVVYDWFSDCRLHLKDDFLHEGAAYNTHENTQIVYAESCGHAPIDTGWVTCEVRDGIGGGSLSKTVHVIIKW